jgi:alpha,alpha-trehalase
MLRGPVLILLLCFLISCESNKEQTDNKCFYDSELFRAVQLKAIFPDSKTFVDLVPKLPYRDLEAMYLSQKNQKDFSLKSFVNEHFYEQSFKTPVFRSDTSLTMYEHIEAMWPQLTRGPDTLIPNSSRIPLPYSYVVPGGRFQEIYYWDSYFTLEGLLASHKQELAKNMVDNFSFLIDSLGHIPNGTRNYYLSRSQPPFFSLMVDAISRENAFLLTEYISALKEEYLYFMDHDTLLKPFTASKHVVKVADHGFLNRYFDSGESPRPEAFKEDFSLAKAMENEDNKKKLYKNLRSAAESGWDFSSRWFSSNTLSSTVTTSILPVDLNCLLYHLEIQLSEGFKLKGESKQAEKFKTLAETRKKNILRYFWNEDQNFFTDYDFTNKIHRKEKTLAGVFPLYFGLATEAQAEATKEILMRVFLKDGGLVTTLKHSGEQWDAPNGWAPLQWVAVKGLIKYGYEEEAKTIMKRWLALNKKVFKTTGKMMEKYNVVDVSLPSGGGEYETQDGFGWTNGVALGFKSILERMKDSPEMK